MNRIKYDINLMHYISLFENITRAKVKDCIDGNPLIFVVEQGEIAKAIGKKGSNIKRVEFLLKKKVKIVEFNEEVELFIRNLIAPLKVEEVTKENDMITIKDPDTKTKGKIIGRESQNLKNYKEIVSRYFNITEIKVI